MASSVAENIELATASGKGRQWLLLVSSVISLCVSAALLALADTRLIALIGYLLAAPVPFTAVAFYRRDAVLWSAATGIAISATRQRFAIGLLVAGFLLTVGHAYDFARTFV